MPSRNISGLAAMWVGIAGAAITLFANLLAPLDMADWAWWLVGNWQEATPLVWNGLAALWSMEVPFALVPPLTMSACLVLIGIGVGLQDRRHGAFATVGRPLLQLIATAVALLTMAYILLAAPIVASTDSSMPENAQLAVFLAGATISFSPIAARGGNLTKRLWYVLFGTGVLITVNELTKMAVLLFV